MSELEIHRIERAGLHEQGYILFSVEGLIVRNPPPHNVCSWADARRPGYRVHSEVRLSVSEVQTRFVVFVGRPLTSCEAPQTMASFSRAQLYALSKITEKAARANGPKILPALPSKIRRKVMVEARLTSPTAAAAAVVSFLRLEFSTNRRTQSTKTPGPRSDVRGS